MKTTSKATWTKIINTESYAHYLDNADSNHILLYENGGWWLCGERVVGATGRAPYQLESETLEDAKKEATAFILQGFNVYKSSLIEMGILEE